jgi:hypothetical protein
MHRPALRIVLAAVAVALVGCHHADSMQLRLLWMPTDNPRDLPSGAIEAFRGQTVAVSVTDTRQNSGPRVGQNNEENTPRPVTTTDNVPAFVSQSFASVLQSNGVTVVPTGATRVLRLELGELFVNEGNLYQGSVTLRVSLENGSGQVLWKGAMRGSSHRFGRSFTEENYEQVISDSTLDALRALLGNPDFQAAVRSNA